MRADEHEGTLTDPDSKRLKDKMDAKARRIDRADVLALSNNGAFLRWFGHRAYTLITGSQPPGSGAALERWMGLREFALRTIEQMDAEEPGFLLRVLEARESLEAQILAAAEENTK